MDGNLKWIKFKEYIVIMRRLAVAVIWEKSNKGLNFPVMCGNRKKEKQFDSKGGENSTKLDD